MLTTVERLCFSTSTFCLLHLFSVKTCLSSPVTPCYETHISGGVPWWNNEIRGISFITDFAILFQSPLSSPDQPRAGNPGRSVVLSTDTQPPSSFPTSSPLHTYLPPLFSLYFTSVLRPLLSVFCHMTSENTFWPFLDSQFFLLSLSIVK